MTASDRDQSMDEMIAAAADFYAFGWLGAGSGNMSCRLDDETVLVTATGSHLRDLSPEDFVEVDFDAKPTGEGNPSGDTEVHLGIYKNLDDAHAVYHVHHLEATLCSDRDAKRGFTHLHEVHMIAALGIEGAGDELAVELPILEASYDELAEAVAEFLGGDESPKVPCINVKNHGLYVWGQNPEAARRHVEACAYLFAYSWRRPMNPKKSSSISGFAGSAG